MCRPMLAGIAVLLLSVGATLGGPPDDQKALQGKWKLVKADGAPPGAPTPDTFIQFENTSFTIFVNGQEHAAGSFRLDATKNPKHLDLRADKKAAPGPQQIVAIYDLRRDSLILCASENGPGTRPTEFVANGPKQMVITFEKIKP